MSSFNGRSVFICEHVVEICCSEEVQEGFFWRLWLGYLHLRSPTAPQFALAGGEGGGWSRAAGGAAANLSSCAPIDGGRRRSRPHTLAPGGYPWRLAPRVVALGGRGRTMLGQDGRPLRACSADMKNSVRLVD
jgi:hypothetical protein